MEVQLLKGRFSAQDAEELLTQLVHVKIRYHEARIAQEDNEEDIKMREKRIIELQQSLYEARQRIRRQDSLDMEGTVKL